MKLHFPSAGISRRVLLAALTVAPALAQILLPSAARAQAPASALGSWNDGPAKQAILDFVRVTTDPSSKDFVRPEERIAEFDQDGTLWVEHPVYTQIVFCVEPGRRSCEGETGVEGPQTV